MPPSPEESSPTSTLRPLSFTEPDIGDEEIRAVTEALRAAQIGGNGAISRRVQAKLAEFCGARRALLTPSATSAMEVALLASGIGPGDEVIMPSFAFVSQANAILSVGARPVFCEVDPATLNFAADDAARRITPRTKLLMPVHYAGVACDMQRILDLAEAHGLQVIEDAAQGIDSKWHGRHLGTIGRAGVYSFHHTKNLVSGEGGAFLTSDEELARAAEIVQEKGTNRSAFLRGEVDKYTWVGRGGSSVLSDLLAALLEVQLSRVRVLTARRLERWQRYHRGLAELERRGRLRRTAPPAYAEHNGHIYFLQAESPELQDRLLVGLRAARISATFHFQPLHASPFARQQLGLDQSLPVTEAAAATLVRLPLHDRLTFEDIDRVLTEVEAICRRA
jgi:dTDP-4-amino-4,6-dideoxygalactose transaminase